MKLKRQVSSRAVNHVRKVKNGCEAMPSLNLSDSARHETLEPA